MKRFQLIFVSILTLLPVTLFAHEGHGIVNTGPAHYLSPEHALPIIALLAVAGYFAWKRILKKA